MTVAKGDDGSAERMGALVRGQREKRELSLGKLAARSGVSAATLSKLERGQRSVTLDLADRVLETMGLRLHVTVEPLWATVDEAIAKAAGRSPAARVAQWRDDGTIDVGAYLTCLQGVRFAIDGMMAAALQGAPVPVTKMEIAVPADDAAALDELTDALDRMTAERGNGWERRDPRIKGSPKYRTWHGPLGIRMVSPFGDFLQVDIDPLPEPNMPPMDRSRLKSLKPLTRATVAVVPIMRIEAQDGAVRRMLARMRERECRELRVAGGGPHFAQGNGDLDGAVPGHPGETELGRVQGVSRLGHDGAALVGDRRKDDAPVIGGQAAPD
jgi:transcriptional regulator with XRE-family HTH domain